MAKFAFPMTMAQFEASITNEHQFHVLANSEEGSKEAIEFAYGCLRQGWMSKQYHKEKQGEDQELMRAMRQRMKDDPKLRAELLGSDRKKGV